MDGVVSFMNTAGTLGINPYGCVATTLKDMGNYPAQWNGMPTEELFKKYNITYAAEFWSKIAPNTDLLKEINSFYNQEKFSSNQVELVEKALHETQHSKAISDVTPGFKQCFSQLNLDGVAAFMHFANRLSINVDGCVGTALKDIGHYPAKWENIPTKEFLEKYGITNPYVSFENKIELSVQDADKIEGNLNEENHSDLESDAESDIEVMCQHFSGQLFMHIFVFLHIR
ncbi:MAG: hypothetical protein O7D30_03305 [Rickettsia endosymbiont of Ixodes persulcatus]|nr:hypothetical protein [Rickettsia endosymbiont of Ixodes persulcatus]